MNLVEHVIIKFSRDINHLVMYVLTVIMSIMYRSIWKKNIGDFMVRTRCYCEYVPDLYFMVNEENKEYMRLVCNGDNKDKFNLKEFLEYMVMIGKLEHWNNTTVFLIPNFDKHWMFSPINYCDLNEETR